MDKIFTQVIVMLYVYFNMWELLRSPMKNPQILKGFQSTLELLKVEIIILHHREMG